MRHRQFLLVGMLVAVAPAVIVGTGSFDVMNAERGVDVAVVADGNAYLNVTVVDDPAGDAGGESFVALRLANQFPGDAPLELVSVTTDGSFVAVETGGTDIGGPSDPLDVRVRCGGSSTGTETVEFSVVAEGPDVQVTLDRPVGISCTEPEITAVRFDGCGNAHVEADDAIYPLTVTQYLETSTGETAVERTTVDGDGPIRAGPGGRLVAVEAAGDRYENPNDCANRSGVPESPPGDGTTTGSENGSG